MPHTIRVQVARGRRVKRWERRLAIACGIGALLLVLSAVLTTAVKEGW